MKSVNKMRKERNFDKSYFVGGNGTVYEDYGRDPQIKQNYELTFNLIRRHKKNGKLLELGCAYGFFLQMAEKYYDCYGIEISKFAFNKAKENTKRSKLYLGNALTLIDRLPMFDIILGHMFFSNLKDPETMLRKCYVHLKKGGFLFMKVPNMDSLGHKLKSKKFFAYRDWTHASLFTKKKWSNILKKIGFKYKIISFIPTFFFKKRLKNTNLVFMPSFFHKFNITQSITFVCWK